MATFQGKQILPLLNLVQKEDGIDFKRVRDILDNKTSRRIIYDKSGVAVATKQYVLKGLTREQYQAFLSFFKSMKGRQTSFYVPSLFQDCHATGIFSAGVNTIEIEGTLYADVYLPASAADRRDSIAVVRYNGQVQALKIAGSIPNYINETEILTFTAPLAASITPNSYICQLSLHRFAEDSLTITALTQHLFDITFNLQTCLE